MVLCEDGNIKKPQFHKYSLNNKGMKKVKTRRIFTGSAKKLKDRKMDRKKNSNINGVVCDKF